MHLLLRYKSGDVIKVYRLVVLSCINIRGLYNLRLMRRRLLSDDNLLRVPFIHDVIGFLLLLHPFYLLVSGFAADVVTFSTIVVTDLVLAKVGSDDRSMEFFRTGIIVQRSEWCSDRMVKFIFIKKTNTQHNTIKN